MDASHTRRDFVTGAAAICAAAVTPVASRAQGSAKKLIDVRIINSNANAQLAFEELLKRQGYLETLGLNATTVNVADGSKVMAALLSGEMDVCMISGFGQVLPAVERGGQIKVVAGANMLTPQGVLTNKANVKSVADLKGAKIGTGPIGALEHQLMVAVLLQHKVDPDSVSFVNIGNTADIFRAVSAGVVDAGPVNIDVYDKQKGDLKIVGNFWTEIPDFPYQGSFTSVDAISNRREAVVRTLAAYCKVYRFLRTPDSKKPYVEAYMAAVGGGAAADAELQWQFLYDKKAFATDLVIPDRGLEFLQDLNLRTNVQKTKLPLDKFADMSLAQEALKLIA